MARLGRPPLPHARRNGVFVRLSGTERGAVERALEAEHPVPARRPTLAEWIRDLVVAHAGEILGVEVTRAALRHAEGGVPDWKRWRIARSVRRAASRRRRKRRRTETALQTALTARTGKSSLRLSPIQHQKIKSGKEKQDHLQHGNPSPKPSTKPGQVQETELGDTPKAPAASTNVS